MPMRRKPRNEPPTVTIRWQRRQLIQMEQTIGALRLACDDKDKVISGFDVQMGEQEDQIRSLHRRNADQAAELGFARQSARKSAERLAYLEGYFYAREKETPINPAPQALRAAGSLVGGYTAETHGAASPRNPEDSQICYQATEGARSYEATERDRSTVGDSLRRQHPHDYRDPQKAKVEHVEISEESDIKRFSYSPRSGWEAF